MSSSELNIDLNPHDLSEVRNILKKHVPHLEVWAFGSRVKWTAKSYSDLDLALLTEKPLAIDELAEIKEAFDESSLIVKVDLVDWAKTSENFKKIIEEQKVVVQFASSVVAADWKPYKISEIGKVVTGKTPKDSAPCFDDKFPFITPADFNGQKWISSPVRFVSRVAANSVKNCILPPESVLVTCIGSDMGKAAINTKSCITNQQINTIVVDRAKFSPEFIFYNLSLRKDEIRQMAGGSAQPILNKTAFSELWISCPPIDMQKSIVDVLRPLDDLIALLRETNATLEAIAQALFKSWFVDFDPVHANAGTQAPSLTPEIQALFPATFTDSPQGPIPEGWEWRDLADVTEILSGFAFKSEDYVSKEDGIFVLRTTNFSDSGFAVKLEKDVHLPESFLESHKKYLCQPFDFHLVMVGASVGHTSLLLPHLLPAFRNQNMWCFREKTGFPSKFFIHEVVKANITDALRSTSGSAREFFRKGDFGARKVLVPNNSVLSIFEEHVSLLKGRLAVNSEKIEYLSETRNTLLPRLISGQLRLPEAEKSIAAITD